LRAGARIRRLRLLEGFGTISFSLTAVDRGPQIALTPQGATRVRLEFDFRGRIIAALKRIERFVLAARAIDSNDVLLGSRIGLSCVNLRLGSRRRLFLRLRERRWRYRE
jgi:hypothetical protein